MHRTIWSGSARARRLGAALAVSLALLSAPAAYAGGAIASRADPQLVLVAERDTGHLRLAAASAAPNAARWKVVGDDPGDVLLHYEFDDAPGGVLHVAKGGLRVGAADWLDVRSRWQLVRVSGRAWLICRRDERADCLHVADGQLRLGSVAPEDPAAGWLIEQAALPAQATGANGGKKNGHGPPPATTRPPSTTPPPPPPPPPPAPAPAPEPVPVPAPAPAAQALPNFPWPPPSATRIVLPRAAVVGRPGVRSQADAADVLVAALEARGYLERGFFRVPQGFALATRLERIGEDGSPAPEQERWQKGNAPGEFSLATILERLAGAPPGRFRVLVFVVTPAPFGASGTPVSGDVAESWVSSGFNQLPREFRDVPVTADTACTVLVYEFERLPVEDTARQVKRLDVRTHLLRSGLAERLNLDW